jgi:hypothetical protein
VIEEMLSCCMSRYVGILACGEGVIDVFDAETYRRLARIPTVSGARTSFFAPELDRFILAVRASGREPAALWLFRPLP